MKPHPLVKTRDGATAESNLADMEVIRGMDEGPEREAAINAMIEANIPLVFSKVKGYMALHPSVSFLHDDLVSEGFMAVIDAVRRLADRDTPEDGGNCTGYIGNRIVWAICRLMEHHEKEQRIPPEYESGTPPVVNPMEEIDTRDLLFGACQTPEDVIILEMRERGCKDKEIAERLSISRRAVGYMRHELYERYLELREQSL